jgi:hypothetical protein
LFVGGPGNTTGLAEKLLTEDGLKGCIRHLEVNDHVYRFNMAPLGDSVKGFDIGKYRRDIIDWHWFPLFPFIVSRAVRREISRVNTDRILLCEGFQYRMLPCIDRNLLFVFSVAQLHNCCNACSLLEIICWKYCNRSWLPKKRYIYKAIPVTSLGGLCGWEMLRSPHFLLLIIISIRG